MLHLLDGRLLLTVTGSSRESTTNTQARSTDISIHLSPARRGEPDSLGADLVALTIRLHHSPEQQYLPDTYHKQVQGPQGTQQPYSGPQQPYSMYLGTNVNSDSPPQLNLVALDRIRLFAISIFQFRHLSPFFCSWVFSAFASLVSVLVSVLLLLVNHYRYLAYKFKFYTHLLLLVNH
jgi:hypothetical protein